MAPTTTTGSIPIITSFALILSVAWCALILSVAICMYVYIFINVPHINENSRPTLAYEAPVTLHNTTRVIINNCEHRNQKRNMHIIYEKEMP